MKENITKVIFRKFKQDDIIAIFPELPGSNDIKTCLCYQHIGQHGICEPYYLIKETKIAKFEECEKLANELTAIGYKLKVCKKYSYKMYQKRNRAIKRYEQSNIKLVE